MSQPPDDDPPADDSRDDGPVRDGDGSTRDDDGSAREDADSLPADGSPASESSAGGTGAPDPPDADDDGDDVRRAGVDDDSQGRSSDRADDPRARSPHRDDETQTRDGSERRRRESMATGDGTTGPSRPAPRRASENGRNEEADNWVWTFFVDVASSALAVLLVGFFLFTVSGVWPPMVAVESGSMTPNMQTGDLVFVMDDDRFPGDGAHADTGVVTAREGADTGYSTFGGPGDVVVYEPDGNGEETPIIHRAMFWVEKDERWYDEADPDAVGGANSCAALANCPAPHAGFITKGDANAAYDQVEPSPHSGPVKPEWIVGTAEARVPKLGCLRLPSERCGDVLSTAEFEVSGLSLHTLDDDVARLLERDALNGTP